MALPFCHRQLMVSVFLCRHGSVSNMNRRQETYQNNNNNNMIISWNILFVVQMISVILRTCLWMESTTAHLLSWMSTEPGTGSRALYCLKGRKERERSLFTCNVSLGSVYVCACVSVCVITNCKVQL